MPQGRWPEIHGSVLQTSRKCTPSAKAYSHQNPGNPYSVLCWRNNPTHTRHHVLSLQCRGVLPDAQPDDLRLNDLSDAGVILASEKID